MQDISYYETHFMSKTYIQFFRCNTLNFLIKFKYIVTLHLIILKKYNIIYILLVNTILCLNLFEYPNLSYNFTLLNAKREDTHALGIHPNILKL
jgi:hypothetical protein